MEFTMKSMKSRTLSFLGALVIACGFAANANANVVNLGDFSGKSFAQVYAALPGAQINDSYVFNLSAPSVFKATANQFSFGTWNIAGLTLALSSPSISPVSFSEVLDTGNVSLAVGNGYELTVTGAATGITGGIYALMMGTASQAILGLNEIAPVPEPAEWLLMMAGLALIAPVVSRRRKAEAQA